MSRWAALLLLGFIANWLVAWACALWSPVGRGGVTGVWTIDHPAPDASELALLTPAERAMFRFDRVPANWRDIRGFMGLAPEVSATRVIGPGVRQANIHYKFDDPLSMLRLCQILVVDCGWPFPCLSAEHFDLAVYRQRSPNGVSPFANDNRFHHEPPGWRTGWEAPHWLSPRPLGFGGGPPAMTILPYRPIWTGMLANTLLWSATLATPPLVLRAARRALRRGRGLCPACGYDVKDLAVCPECGAVTNATQ